MDRDTFVERHRLGWTRLDQLLRQRHLTADETDELVRLYLRASSHLATAQRRYRDPRLLIHLNQLVGRASARVYGARAGTLRGLWLAARITFPAAVWHARRPIAIAAACFLAVFALTTVWLGTSPAALELAIPPEQQQALLDHDFEAYYSSQPAGQFAALVFTNNARIGILAFAAGIAFGLPTLFVLAYNGLNVGVMAGLFHAAGAAPQFWTLILPHGLLELTAVFVAGGAGLRIGWSVVAPGDRSRREALAEEARRAIVIVTGLVVVFLVAGMIEAFVTPSGLPAVARVGTGVAAWAAFAAYVVGYGRAAAAAGYTGAPGELRRQSRPVALTSR